MTDVMPKSFFFRKDIPQNYVMGQDFRLNIEGRSRNFNRSCKRESVFIPKMPLIWYCTVLVLSDYPFEFKRFKFPVKLRFAMIISKVQGQSIKLWALI
jgi:hypothetical protein